MTSISDQVGIFRTRAKITIASTVPRKPPWKDMPPCQSAKISSGFSMKRGKS